MIIFKDVLNFNNNRTLYLDVDDIVLQSSQTAIQLILSKERNKNNPIIQKKNFYSLKDENFKSIDRKISKQEIKEIFESDIFFQQLNFNQDFMKNLESELFDCFNWSFVTRGSKNNIIKKYEKIFSHPFFSQNQQKISFYGLEENEEKSKIKMLTGIQIDCYYENLVKTDASIKILLKNSIDTDYNSIFKIKNENLENLYVVDNINQITEILPFIQLLEKK